MKLVLATLCLALAITGQIFAAYKQEWTSFFIASPFTAQFSYFVYYAYEKQQATLKALKSQLQKAKAQNQKLRKIVKALTDKGDQS